MPTAATDYSAKKLAPVFIIGGSRTGSEMLKTMLSASPELDFVDEMFLLCPRWLHRDLRSNIREHVGDLDAPGALDKLLDLMFSGVPYGWFWTAIDTESNRDMLQAALQGKRLDLREIFLALMLVHAEIRGKSGIGAKFPMHYSYTDVLLHWFPSCRLIHTTRNPKAVLASQSNKYLREGQGRLSRAFLKSQHYAHINLQVSWTARLHKRLAGLPNYRLLRYEDVVRNPQDELQQICDFLGVPFIDEMLKPKQYGSSFSKIGGDVGVDESSLERWRNTISPLTSVSMDILHRSANRLLGYENLD